MTEVDERAYLRGLAALHISFARAVPAGALTLGTDNGSRFTSRDFRRHLCARGVTHRRGGYYRTPADVVTTRRDTRDRRTEAT